jgi:MerR HTH family regulatory protein
LKRAAIQGRLMPESGLVPIGEPARRAGVATSAQRYYERIGLLTSAERLGQRRHYRYQTRVRQAAGMAAWVRH